MWAKRDRSFLALLLVLSFWLVLCPALGYGDASPTLADLLQRVESNLRLLKDNNNLLQSQLAESMKKVQTLEQTSTSLSKELTISKQDLQKTQNELTLVKEELKTVSFDLEQVRSALAQSLSDLAASKESLNNSESALERLRTESETLKTLQKEVQTSLTKLSEKLTQLETALLKTQWEAALWRTIALVSNSIWIVYFIVTLIF